MQKTTINPLLSSVGFSEKILPEEPAKQLGNSVTMSNQGSPRQVDGPGSSSYEAIQASGSSFMETLAKIVPDWDQVISREQSLQMEKLLLSQGEKPSRRNQMKVSSDTATVPHRELPSVSQPAFFMTFDSDEESKASHEKVHGLAQKLGYEVQQCSESRLEQVKNHLLKFRSLDRSIESFMAYISGAVETDSPDSAEKSEQGTKYVLSGCNGEQTSLAELLQTIIAEVSDTNHPLNDKPKFIILKAERKSAFENRSINGILRESTEKSSAPAEERLKGALQIRIEEAEWNGEQTLLQTIPNAENLCVIHSATPNFLDEGDFTNSICKTFSQYAHPDCDFSSLCTATNRMLRDAFEEKFHGSFFLMLMNTSTTNISPRKLTWTSFK